VRPDLLPTEVPAEALVNSINWIRRRGTFRVRPGYNVIAESVVQRPTGFAEYRDHDGARRLVQATTLGWWRFNPITALWVNITGTPALTGSAVNLQTFQTFSKAGVTWLLGVNGKDVPIKWDGDAATYAAIGGTPPVAGAMMTLASRVLLGNLMSGGTISPVAIDVSALNDFDAGWGSVLVALRADSPGAIVAMRSMGFLQGAIYKEDAIDMALAQEGDVPFRFEVRAPNIRGPVSAAAITALSDSLHVYLGTDGAVYTFDGSLPQSLGLHVQRAIANVWDPVRAGRSWVAWDAEEQTLYVVFVALGQLEPHHGVAITFPGAHCYPIRWNVLQPTAGAKVAVTSALTIGELVGAIGQQTAVLADYDTVVTRFMIGNVNGQSYVDSGITDADYPIPARFQPGVTSLGQRGAWKTIQEIDHRFVPTPTTQLVQVQAGVSEYGEAITWDAPDVDLWAAIGDDIPWLILPGIGGPGGGIGDLGGIILPPSGVPIQQPTDENTIDLVTGGPYTSGHRLTGRDLAMRVALLATQDVTWDGGEATVALRGRR
jgi:hypothetical protein